MQKKLLILLLALLILSLFAGCTSGLLPGTDEPDSDSQPDSTPVTTSRVVMFELFEGPACSLCAGVHPDIVRLRKEYGFDELIILEEYGSDGAYTGWGVYDALKRIYIYQKYSGVGGGYPDAYFNGLNQTVHQENRGYVNYKTAIIKELAKPAKITISAAYSVNGQVVNINGNITNISSDVLSSLAVEAMVYEDSVYSEYRRYNVDHVVRDIITYEETGGEELIASFAPEDSYEFSLTSSSLGNVHEMSNIHVVVYVQSSTKEILQALYVE